MLNASLLAWSFRWVTWNSTAWYPMADLQSLLKSVMMDQIHFPKNANILTFQNLFETWECSKGKQFKSQYAWIDNVGKPAGILEWSRCPNLRQFLLRSYCHLPQSHLRRIWESMSWWQTSAWPILLASIHSHTHFCVLLPVTCVTDQYEQPTWKHGVNIF